MFERLLSEETVHSSVNLLWRLREAETSRWTCSELAARETIIAVDIAPTSVQSHDVPTLYTGTNTGHPLPFHTERVIIREDGLSLYVTVVLRPSIQTSKLPAEDLGSDVIVA